MAHAYTPGLKVSEHTTVAKERLLPLQGEVLVHVGDHVEADTIVARASLPGAVAPVNVANKLGLAPAEVPESMLKQVGDRIEKGEILARTRGFFGLFKSECTSPMTGSITNISKVTGQVMLQGPPLPVEVQAYVQGEITSVMPEEGAVVEAHATFVQGIFGVGGETHGTLRMIASTADDVLDVDNLPTDATGLILVGGALVTYEALIAARERGAVAVVVGGFHDADLRLLLGADLGVAITGNEDLGITLVVTEGFGSIAMADGTFRLLRERAGREASVNGATQIRAGVMRPEIIVPLTSQEIASISPSGVRHGPGLQEGDVVRIIRQPHFGRLGKVVELPVPLQQLESESMARVLVLDIPGVGRRMVARANVEAIEAN
jgi:hypothetical protein